MPKRVSIEQIISMVQQGYAESDIMAYLQEQGSSAKEIADALNQAKIKLELAETAGEEYESQSPEETAVEGTAEEYGPTAPPEPASVPAPASAPIPQRRYAPEEQQYQQYPAQPAEYPAYPAAAVSDSSSVEAIEEIAEGIIAEKWDEFKEKIGDVSELKSYVESRLNELNDRVKRLEIAQDKLHAATLEKVEVQSRSVKTLGSEIQALEGTLGKVMKPLVGSVKELREITKGMKKAPKTTAKPAMKSGPKKK